MVDVLHPTNHTVVDPTVNNPENAYNGDLGNRASLVEGAAGGVAELTVFDFPDGTISVGARASVVLNINGRFNTGVGPFDAMSVLFRADFRDSWIIVETDVNGNAWPTQPDTAIWRDFDVTIPAGIIPASGFQVGLQFFNDEAPGSDPPAYSQA
jgi:hypothetical protein